MGHAPGPRIVPARAVLTGVALLVTLLPTACGSSLADADRPDATRTRHTPAGDFCAAVMAGTDAARPLATLVDRGASVPRDQITEAAEHVRSANAEVLATAPGEIRDDVERSVTEADLQLDALEAAGGDTAAVDRDATARGQAGQDYAAAAGRVRDYVGNHCGIDARRLGS
jgi:hypothetical protein